MSAPGTPKRDAAAAACRNAAAELAEIHNRVAAATAAVLSDVPDQTAFDVRAALHRITRAADILDAAADDLYRDEEEQR